VASWLVFAWSFYRGAVDLAAARAAPARGKGERVAVLLAPGCCALLLFWVLAEHSAVDVRSSSLYLVFYLSLGCAWVGLATRWLPYLGVSIRDDVVERRNPAAAMAIVGMMFGLTFAFAGGNVGNGPGWWCVVICAGLATASLGATWLALHVVAGVPETLTVDRDVATGVRVGVLVALLGMVFGRAAAGDWVSVGDTVWTFSSLAWPGFVIAAVAAPIELTLRPTAERPRRSVLTAGLGPAALYTVGAFVALRWAGLPW